MAMVNVLFLCTGNSARSILSEALLNDLGERRFKAFSAGSQPSGRPHPDGLAELRRRGHAIKGYRSKSWNEFSGDAAPVMDIIVTVCGNAANEICPIWPRSGQNGPVTVHWPADDPAHVEPLEARQAAFSQVYEICRSRIETLIGFTETELRDRRKLQSIAKVTA